MRVFLSGLDCITNSVGDAKIPIHRVYTGMTYSAAGAQLVKDSKLKSAAPAPKKKAA